MVDLAKTGEAPLDQLFDEISRVDAGMLGIAGGRFMAPMYPHVERERRKIYFFVRRSSHLVASIGAGSLAQFCLVGKDHDYYACLSGPVVQSTDDAAIDRHWSVIVSAWFPRGRDDPDMTLLEFTPGEAQIWATTDSTVKLAWEMTKALVGGGEPDVGLTLKIDISGSVR